MQLRLRRLLSEFHTSTPRPYKIFASITSCFSPYVSFVTSPRHPYTNLQVQLVSPALLGSLQLFTASKLVPFSLKPDVKAFKSTSFWHWSAVNYTLSHTWGRFKNEPTLESVSVWCTCFASLKGRGNSSRPHNAPQTYFPPLFSFFFFSTMGRPHVARLCKASFTGFSFVLINVTGDVKWHFCDKVVNSPRTVN